MSSLSTDRSSSFKLCKMASLLRSPTLVIPLQNNASTDLISQLNLISGYSELILLARAEGLLLPCGPVAVIREMAAELMPPPEPEFGTRGWLTELELAFPLPLELEFGAEPPGTKVKITLCSI